MRIELTYRLSPGLRAENVDFSYLGKKIALTNWRNPEGDTIVQVFNNWFNVKIVMIDAAGTKTVVDYAKSELQRYYRSSHNVFGAGNKKASSFILAFSRALGEMSIKVVHRDPNEEPILIKHRHLYAGPARTPIAHITPLEEEKEYRLPHTSDPLFSERGDIVGYSGASIYFLDKNKPILPAHHLLKTDLQAFSANIRTEMSYAKNNLSNRGYGDYQTFVSNCMTGEIHELSKNDAVALLEEIKERHLYPNVIGGVYLQFLIKHVARLVTLECEAISKVLGVTLNTETEPEKAVEQPTCSTSSEPEPESWADAFSDFDVEAALQQLEGSLQKPEFNFKADGTDAFDPDDFLIRPSSPKRAKTVAE